ncbi:MAG: replication protein [Pseudoxanthomonas suwonensis]|nr:MAG: replication protein [Pseudoxanthomonas suwonensis]
MNLNDAPHTPARAVADRAGLSGLPSSNRGVNKKDRTWAGIDWVAGSVDLLELLELQGRDVSPAAAEGISVHLAAYGPKPRPKTPVADDDGVAVVGTVTPFIPADSVIDDIAREAFEYLFAGTGLCLSRDAGPGKFYAYRYMIRNVFDEPAGMIELGGSLTIRKGGRPSLRFELTGLGCAILEGRGDASADHAQPWCALRAKLERVSPLLARVDIAYDDFDGIRSLEIAKAMYYMGQFDYRFGGKLERPKSRMYDDMGSGDGTTLYVGHSSSAKQLRVYEKGKQLGDSESPWVRWEVQLRGSTRCRVTLDVLSDPQSYMRGAYECLDFITSCMKRLETTREATKATVKSVIRHCKRMYGSTLRYLHRLAPTDDDFLQFFDKLGKDKPPRWVKSGRLTWADVPDPPQCPV